MGTFKDLQNDAKQSDSYWSEKLVVQFIVQLSQSLERNNISKTEFAKRIGSTQAYVTKILRGNANFTLNSIVKLARAAECEVDMNISPKKEKKSWDNIVHLRKGWRRCAPKDPVWSAPAGFPSQSNSSHRSGVGHNATVAA